MFFFGQFSVFNNLSSMQAIVSLILIRQRNVTKATVLSGKRYEIYNLLLLNSEIYIDLYV